MQLSYKEEKQVKIKRVKEIIETLDCLGLCEDCAAYVLPSKKYNTKCTFCNKFTTNEKAVEWFKEFLKRHEEQDNG